MWERFADRHCTLGEARMMEGSAADVASRRIILHLVLRYRRVMAYVASRRIIFFFYLLPAEAYFSEFLKYVAMSERCGGGHCTLGRARMMEASVFLCSA